MTFILWSFKIIMTPWLTTFSLESLVQCHYPHPGLIAARPESRNRLNKICLRKWSRLNDFKRQKHHARLLHQRQLIQEVKKQNKTHKHFINCRPHLPSFRVCESVIRKRLGEKNSIHGRKVLLTKKQTKAHLTFGKKHLDDPFEKIT